MLGFWTFGLGLLVGILLGAAVVLRNRRARSTRGDETEPIGEAAESQGPSAAYEPEPAAVLRPTPDAAPDSDAAPDRAASPDPEVEAVVATRWRPPYIADQQLFEWARSVSRGTVRSALHEGASPGEITEMVKDLYDGASEAMHPDASPGDRALPTACPSHGRGVMGVSAPEAIALAEWLRGTLTPEQLDELIEDVTFCDEMVENHVTEPPCALQGEDHVCIAFGAHPLSCRPTLAVALARHVHDRLPSARTRTEADIDAVTRGVVEGLHSGLRQAGLDSTRYELHSALRRALTRPGVGEAWRRGEDAFAGCRVE